MHRGVAKCPLPVSEIPKKVIFQFGVLSGLISNVFDHPCGEDFKMEVKYALSVIQYFLLNGHISMPCSTEKELNEDGSKQTS